MGDGTSVSTLSVEISNRGSSADTVSPTFLNHRRMVPSVTVSPNCGSAISAMSLMLSFSVRCVPDQPLNVRPVRERTVSPNNSDRLGCGWMNSATSSTVASQFTAR